MTNEGRAHALLRELRSRGAVVTAEGGRLRVDAPTGVVTEALRGELAACKADLVAVLAGAGAIGAMGDPGGDAKGQAGDAAMQVSPTALLRLRAGLSRGLRRWDDAHLVALVAWHLAVAFDRGGANGFRTFLPPALARLTDAVLGQLVDWPSLATLEETLWRSDPEVAARIGQGARQLATWWNAR